EVAEWLKAAVSKTVMGVSVHRGFESPPLRLDASRHDHRTADALRAVRRRAVLPGTRGGVLRARGDRPGAARALPGRRSRPGRGAAADVPRAVLERSGHVLGAPGSAAPPHAPRAVHDRSGRPRPLAPADASGARRAVAGTRAGCDAV